MDVDEPLALLGGLTPATFMRRHWQKQPLLVRGAVAGRWGRRSAGPRSSGSRQSDDVESRLVVRDDAHWSVRHGPLPRRVLPPLARPAVDVAGAGRRPARAGSPRAAAPVPLRAGRAARRPDGVLRDRWRGRRAARRLVRRLPAAGARAAALAHRPGRPVRRSCRACRSRSWRASTPPATGCSSPATCSTCRPGGGTTAPRWASA
jgi:hypothetical protein